MKHQLMGGNERGKQEEKTLDLPKDETDLSLILNKRMERINSEMYEFNGLIQDFAFAVDSEMQNFTVNMGHLQKNLNRVHMMKVGEDNGGGKREQSNEHSSNEDQK